MRDEPRRCFVINIWISLLWLIDEIQSGQTVVVAIHSYIFEQLVGDSNDTLSSLHNCFAFTVWFLIYWAVYFKLVGSAIPVSSLLSWETERLDLGISLIMGCVLCECDFSSVTVVSRQKLWLRLLVVLWGLFTWWPALARSVLSFLAGWWMVLPVWWLCRFIMV